MQLAAQSVQSIDDLFLIRIFSHSDDDVRDNRRIDRVGSNPDFHRNDDAGLEYGGTSLERMPSHEVTSWARTAARMLQEQWPRQDRERQQYSEFHADHRNINENIDSKHNDHEEKDAHISLGADNDRFYQKMIVHHEKSHPCYSLACSYILLKHSAQASSKALVLGHGRLTECYESAGGNAAAATYIFIDPEYRGKGYGRTLVRLLEQEAKSMERLGCQYHFVYLWCKSTTAPFYERSGYLPCRNRVSLQRPCLKALTATSVQSIEDILQRHQRHRGTAPMTTKKEATSASAKMMNGNHTASNTKKKLETIMLLPSSSLPSSQSRKDNLNEISDGDQSVTEEDVWLRKRLVDHVESIRICEQDRRNEIEHFVLSTNTSSIISNDKSTNTIVVEENNLDYSYQYRWIPHVPWQMQIGPSCGLTAIRMIRDFYYKTNTDHREEPQEGSTPSPPSLLADARKRGYTDDGEMFDANHLRDLMKDQLQRVVTGSLPLNDSTTASGSMDTVTVRTRETSSLTLEEIDSTLRQRGLWILAYDANPRTKLPGKFQGRHAHWGIVVGILYARTTNTQTSESTDTTTRVVSTATSEDISNENLTFGSKKQMQNEMLIQGTNSDDGLSRPPIIPKEEETGLMNNGSLDVKPNVPADTDAGLRLTASTPSGCIEHLIVQHSLSSKWAIAPMEKWFDSNFQLITINEDKFEIGDEGHLNLKNKIIQVLPT